MGASINYFRMVNTISGPKWLCFHSISRLPRSLLPQIWAVSLSMYSQTHFRVFWLLTLFFLASSPVFSTMILTVSGDIFAGSFHDVQWARDPNDPDIFVLTQFDLDAMVFAPRTENVVVVAVNGSLTGKNQVFFNNSDHFQIFAYADDNTDTSVSSLFLSISELIFSRRLAESNEFIVVSPTSTIAGKTVTSASLPASATSLFQSEGPVTVSYTPTLTSSSSSVTTAGTGSPTSTNIATSHSKSTTSEPQIVPSVPALQSPSSTRATHVPVGVIAGAIVGSLAFVGVMVGILYCWLQRRNRLLELDSPIPFPSTFEIKSGPSEKLPPTRNLIISAPVVNIPSESHTSPGSNTPIEAMAAEMERIKAENRLFPPEYASSRERWSCSSDIPGGSLI
ncbi:hypothetical protein C8J56DRAFT_954062 [Mycena floridula]|nr:hypothetical protein C8J56DRAFT_954062 [Mycena floridula]